MAKPAKNTICLWYDGDAELPLPSAGAPAQVHYGVTDLNLTDAVRARFGLSRDAGRR